MSNGTPLTCETIGGPHQQVSADQLDELLTRKLAEVDLAGKKVTLVIPDGTRSCPCRCCCRRCTGI